MRIFFFITLSPNVELSQLHLTSISQAFLLRVILSVSMIKGISTFSSLIRVLTPRTSVPLEESCYIHQENGQSYYGEHIPSVGIFQFLRPAGSPLCDPMGYSLPGSSVHEFSRQEYWSGLPFPSPEDLPDPEIKPRSPALQVDALPSEPQAQRTLG